MLFLKAYLLFGLIVHKAVWEILKRKQTASGPAQSVTNKVSGSFQLRLVKLTKIVILLGIAVQIFLPDLLPISHEPFLIRVVGTTVYTIGLLLAIRSRAELGANWSDIETARISGEHVVISNGPYRYIRHPIYVGDLLLLVGLELALNSWFALGVLLLAPIVLRQALREEEKLASRLPAYQKYCAETKRFIPFVV